MPSGHNVTAPSCPLLLPPLLPCRTQTCVTSDLGYDCSLALKSGAVLHWTPGGASPPPNACTSAATATASSSSSSADLVHMALSSPQAGYVSIAFAAKSGVMSPANALIGRIDASGAALVEAYPLEGYDVGTAVATSAWGVEGAGVVFTSAGGTVLCFSIPASGLSGVAGRRRGRALAQAASNLGLDATGEPSECWGRGCEGVLAARCSVVRYTYIQLHSHMHIPNGMYCPSAYFVRSIQMHITHTAHPAALQVNWAVNDSPDLVTHMAKGGLQLNAVSGSAAMAAAEKEKFVQVGWRPRLEAHGFVSSSCRSVRLCRPCSQPHTLLLTSPPHACVHLTPCCCCMHAGPSPTCAGARRTHGPVLELFAASWVAAGATPLGTQRGSLRHAHRRQRRRLAGRPVRQQPLLRQGDLVSRRAAVGACWVIGLGWAGCLLGSRRR